MKINDIVNEGALDNIKKFYNVYKQQPANRAQRIELNRQNQGLPNTFKDMFKGATQPFQINQNWYNRTYAENYKEIMDEFNRDKANGKLPTNEDEWNRWLNEVVFPSEQEDSNWSNYEKTKLQPYYQKAFTELAQMFAKQGENVNPSNGFKQLADKITRSIAYDLPKIAASQPTRKSTTRGFITKPPIEPAAQAGQTELDLGVPPQTVPAQAKPKVKKDPNTGEWVSADTATAQAQPDQAQTNSNAVKFADVVYYPTEKGWIAQNSAGGVKKGQVADANTTQLLNKAKDAKERGLAESIRDLSNKIDRISLVESKGHLDHPEDLVLLHGSQGAQQAISSIEKTIKQPKNISIKWDGYPALIFGRGPNGKFSIMDKHMFNKKDGSGRNIYSPQDFVKYDAARGVNRGELERIISEIWPGLERETKGTKGYYWGDLLFHKPLAPNSEGLYSFKANPNGITYTVDPSSDLGKLMTKKIAGVAVHQYIDPYAQSTDEAVSLNGTIGQLQNNSNVAIVPSALPNIPKLKIDTKALANAKKVLSKNASVIDNFLNNAPQAKNAFSNLFTVYINKKIISNNLENLVNDFYSFIETRNMTTSMKAKITDYLNKNKAGIKALFETWISIYNLKMSIVQQLNSAASSSPVQGYLDNGHQTQEGFVSQGLKFIDRLGFSRQNLAGR